MAMPIEDTGYRTTMRSLFRTVLLTHVRESLIPRINPPRWPRVLVRHSIVGLDCRRREIGLANALVVLSSTTEDGEIEELTSGSPLAKVKLGWRSASLRQHPGRRQASLEMQLGDSSTSPKGGVEAETPTPPRKSNWEVIEHFNTSSTSSIRGRPTHSSSLIAVRTLGRQQEGGMGDEVGMSRGASIKEEEEDEEAADCEAGNLMNGDRRAPRDIQGDVESILLMTSNTNAGASWSQLRRLLHRLCRSHRFKNLEVCHSLSFLRSDRLYRLSRRGCKDDDGQLVWIGQSWGNRMETIVN
uniref:Uncharacterized protein n=1 Tax=Timema monikensis TaxID=170555 RepID=A0A7R9E0G1_9NEOP|nr:unnamed protein product [Timema monikensis]